MVPYTSFLLMCFLDLLITTMVLNYLPTFIKDKKIGQVGKFLITGCSNTFVDFFVLSVLLFFAPAPSSVAYLIYKVIAFSFASTNSYVLNKYYVFKSSTTLSSNAKHEKREGLSFLFSCLIGLLANVAVSTAIFSWLINTYPDMPILLAGNLGALSGTVLCLWWNFVAYKYVVFKVKPNSILTTA